MARHAASALKSRKRTADDKENAEASAKTITKKSKIASSNPQPSPTTITTTAAAANMTTVNIAISNHIPLRDIGGQHDNVPDQSGNITLLPALSSPPVPSPMNSPTWSTASSSDIEYPSIGELLQEIHNETMLRHYNLPLYEVILVQHGIATVNDIVGKVNDNFFAEIGFPSEDFVLKVFRDRARQVKLLAEGCGVSQPRI